MSVVVKDLFQRIESLSAKDRQELDKLLAESVEEEWQAEAKKARRQMKKRGLTIADIDRAIERRRYGT